ncbi:beta-1,6-galactofuranosyltransferase [Lacticaseibacillus paracasei]|nr:beta-1,6-galactofuranosyltransferase [Lacticaseibacillus paracasei]
MEGKRGSECLLKSVSNIDFNPIWKHAAAANWVTENHVGFAVENLADIWPIIENFTEDQYNAMQPNLARVSKLIRNGVFAKHAALDALLAVNEPYNKW